MQYLNNNEVDGLQTLQLDFLDHFEPANRVWNH